MQRLPSHEFYERFSDLRGLINTFKQQWGLTASMDTSTENTTDEIESEHSEDENELLEEISEALSSRRTLSRTELETDLAELLVDDPSQVSQPDFESSEAAQRILDDFGDYAAQGANITSPRHSNRDCTQEQLEHPAATATDALHPASERGVFVGASADSIPLLNQQTPLNPFEVAQLPDTVRSRGSVVSGVDVIKLHQPPLATSTSNITQQKQAHRGTIRLQCDCPVDVKSLFLWAQHFSDKDRVCEIIDRYPVLFSESFLLTRRPDVVLRIPPTSYIFWPPVEYFQVSPVRLQTGRQRALSVDWISRIKLFMILMPIALSLLQSSF
ncbi:hypothetical protein V7S43_007017 [Phytophthora oleae]|uniref:Uncharacterized protein n=1 Tax=Phytophthora oleae TaxID=2107226 RepID=A0ABD3FRA0_9STRA